MTHGTLSIYIYETRLKHNGFTETEGCLCPHKIALFFTFWSNVFICFCQLCLVKIFWQLHLNTFIFFLCKTFALEGRKHHCRPKSGVKKTFQPVNSLSNEFTYIEQTINNILALIFSINTRLVFVNVPSKPIILAIIINITDLKFQNEKNPDTQICKILGKPQKFSILTSRTCFLKFQLNFASDQKFNIRLKLAMCS